MSLPWASQAEANFFDFFGKIFGNTNESSGYSVNSQTMAVLSAPININPLAGTGGGDISVVQNSALMAATGPLGSIADVVERKPDAISLYVVRDGDSLSDIAKLFDVSVNTILWANDLRRGSFIKPGQVLVILPITGLKYTIKKGDTIAGIAKKFGADVGDILAFNGLSPMGALEEGLEIIIPNGEAEVLPVSSGVPRRVRGASGPDYQGYFLRPIIGGRKSQGLHGYNGIDLANTCGEPILASAAGDVIIARPAGWNGGYGQYVVISHANGTQTLYSHMSAMIVSAGWHVVQGQIIGYIGRTGLATGCHLHFEVRGARNPF